MKLKLIKEQDYLYTEDKKWHLPLGNNLIISNLGLLPEIVVEDDVEKLPYEQLCYYDARNPNNVLSLLQEDKLIENSYQEEGIDFATNGCMCDNCFYGRTKLATQKIKTATKLYSEDDLKSMFAYAHQLGMNAILQIQSPYLAEKQNHNKLRDEFIRSLKQPKYFIAEKNCGEIKQCICKSNNDCLNPVLKTTTVDGKTYLVGTYLYE